jgi:hypothetical protein
MAFCADQWLVSNLKGVFTMYTRKSVSHWLQLGLAAAVISGMAGAAQAATVTFSNIMDGDGSNALFDTSTTVPSGDGDTLDIGLNNFTADGTFISSALDTLSLTITADPGRSITSITYTESGSGETANGAAFATGSIVADNQPINFPTVFFNQNQQGAWTITPESQALTGKIFIANKESIGVSITNSLMAVAFAPNEIARISKTNAFLTVNTEVNTVPLPAAGWMFGSALISLVIGARRRLTAATTT